MTRPKHYVEPTLKQGEVVYHKRWRCHILLVQWAGRWWEGLIDDELDLFFEDELEVISEAS